MRYHVVLTYEHPRDVHLERGGCAQIEFFAKKNDAGIVK